jgi:hypothetical protein
MKKYLILVLIVLLIGALFVVVLAAPAGKSNVAHLYLYQKTYVASGDWPIVEGGAWGKMKYNLSGEEFEFVFNGHGLVPGTEYTLIYYPDPWPVSGLICLGDGIVNDGGNIHIAESVETGNLPAESDDNCPYGAKIFLVLSSDVNCENRDMPSWTGPWSGNHDGINIYLFEGELITFVDTSE